MTALRRRGDIGRWNDGVWRGRRLSWMTVEDAAEETMTVATTLTVLNRSVASCCCSKRFALGVFVGILFTII